MSTQTVNPFFSWSPAGRSLVVQLDHGVIDRMNVEVMRGFGVTRRRGTETGGVLIGRIDRREKPVIHIQDFEVVPCEYASGPSYVLSESDRERFRQVAAKWQPMVEREWYAVGYFRSHTREGFSLDQNDAELVREFLADPLHVALLVKPFATRTATAGFFLKNGSVLETATSPLEFPFETPGNPVELIAEPGPKLVAVTNVAEPLPTARPTKMSAPPAAASDPGIRVQPVLPETVASPSQAVDPQRPNSSSIRTALWVVFSLALLALGVALGFEIASRRTTPIPVPASSAARTGMPNADLYNVQLQTVGGVGAVTVKWNRDSAPIQAALHGVLTVSEGENTREVKLGFAEIRNGVVLYPRVAAQIRFRLELFFADNRTFVQTVEFQAPAAP